MRAELANRNHCAVPFLSRAAVNLCWYYYILCKMIMFMNFQLMECIDKVRTLGESKIRLLEDHIRTHSLKFQSTFDQAVANHSKIIEVHKREMNRIVFAISK